MDETEPLPIPSWLIVDAVHYALWRQTYIDATADWLVEHWHKLPENAREVIERLVDDAFRRDNIARGEGWKIAAALRPLGTDAQRKDWERVRALYAEG